MLVYIITYIITKDGASQALRKRSFPKHEDKVLEQFLSGFDGPGAKGGRIKRSCLKMEELAGADFGNFQGKLSEV